jgi:hypothetical protein
MNQPLSLREYSLCSSYSTKTGMTNELKAIRLSFFFFHFNILLAAKAVDLLYPNK